jgi:hypothetical protein
MRKPFLALAALTLLATSACNIKLTALGDEVVESLGCSLRTPIYIGSSDLSGLAGRRWTDVELNKSIETETITRDQRYQRMSLSFFEMYYRTTASSEQRSTRRLGARLDVGTDSVGFANVYDGLMPFTLSDNTHNDNRVFKTSFFGFEHPTTRTKETWEIDVIINNSRVTAMALTVPVMQRNSRTTFTSYTFSGRNEKLCVTDARD